MQEDFSDYIVYVDESGNLGTGNKTDKDFPLFVLAFCVFKKTAYAERVVPDLKKFKFKYWGHDLINLHEREIRKNQGAFAFLSVREKREEFLSELSKIIENAPFAVIAAVIRTQELKNPAASPYFLAMKFCLERLKMFLDEKREIGKKVFIIFERRGKREDRELELEFRRIAGGCNFNGEILPFEIMFATKQTDCAGIQLADMIARPVGLYVLRPKQANRTYEIIEKKFHRNAAGKIEGCGLKIYPPFQHMVSPGEL